MPTIFSLSTTSLFQTSHSSLLCPLADDCLGQGVFVQNRYIFKLIQNFYLYSA